MTFFAITLLDRMPAVERGRTPTVRLASAWSPTCCSARERERVGHGDGCTDSTSSLTAHTSSQYALQLQVIQLHRRRPSEQRHRHPHLSLVRHHLFDRSVEIGERSFGDRHRLTDEERNLFLRLLLLRLVGDAEEAVDFFGAQRLREARSCPTNLITPWMPLIVCASPGSSSISTST